MASLQDLITAFRSGQLKLPALFDALSARGAVSAEEHARDTAWLERLRDEQGFDPAIARALLAKLASMQPAQEPPAPADEPPDEDVTRILTSGASGDASAADATRVAPPAQPEDDGTLVRPRAVDGGDSATIVQPPSRPTPTQTQGTGGSSDSSLNASTWQRVAGESSGEYATVGMLLKGRFLLERELGRGGMGVVYLARDERKVEARDRDPYVAVKVLNDEFRRHPDSLIALQREARRSQQLAHDNIVRVYDFDKDGTIVFMTMEYVDGTNLKTLIRERAFNGLSLAEARPLIEGMAWALKRAHAAGVVHSDFKPGNVMVTKDGVPKVFDFGIARAGKHLGDAVGEQTVFDAGTLGALTPAYASLEMIQGRDPVPGDDVYALGCVAFELLTGKHPYDKASAEVAMREGRKPPPVKGLTKLQYKTLCASVAFRAEDRLKSANELVEGLRDISLRERAMPYLIYGVPAILIVAGGAWGWITYQHNHHLDEVVQRFALTRPDHYASETQALQALDTLSEDDRKRIIVDQSDLIQKFLLARLDAYWTPDQGRYDYAGTQQVFKLRDDLKLYSPSLDIRRGAIEKQRNDLLNALDTQLGQQIGAGAIFENQPDNVVKTLDKIRAIDPTSALLKNTELELKYDTAIGKSLDAGKVDEAMAEFKLASRLFPDSTRIRQRGAQLDEMGKAIAAQRAQQERARQLQQQREQSLQALAGLLDHPANTDDWRNQLAAAYQNAGKLLAGDPQLARQADRAKQALASQAAEKQSAGDLADAISIAGFGVNLFPGDVGLSSTRQKLLEQQNQLAQKAASEAQRNALAKGRVEDLLARPLGTTVWLQDVGSALSTARSQIGADSPGYAEVRGQVDASLIKLARERLASGALDDAERIVQAGQRMDPAERDYAKVLAEVAAARSAAEQRTVQEQAQAIAAARRTLAGLSAKPLLTPEWQQSVASAMATLHGDHSPETERVIDELAASIATVAAGQADPQHLPQARLAVDFGLKYIPQSPRLTAESAKLDALQADLAAKAAQESAEAEVKSRIESMRSAAAADDVTKASQSLERIRTLQPDNPFLQSEGPKLLADAYLGLAQDTFQKGRYQQAADVLGRGLHALTGNAQLRAAKARYELVAAIMAAGRQPIGLTEYAQLKRQLESMRRSDAKALAAVEADMRIRGQLPAKTLEQQLERFKPSVSAPPPAPVAQTPAPEQGALPGRPVPIPQAGAPTSIRPGSPPTTATRARPSGSDACAKPGLAGTGKFCLDQLGTSRGPFLVVVPGVGGGRPYAMSRAEISINEFNAFCRATGKCAAKSVADPDLGNAPISNISLDQARAYARWLSDLSGFTYRLPTDAE